MTRTARLWIRWAWRRLTSIGHAHRYVTDDGVVTPFCVVCGVYP